MTVTPMQLAQVTAVLAAQGAVFKPRLVTGMRDPDTGKTTQFDPKPLPHVKGGTPEQWEVIMEGMRATHDARHRERASRIDAPNTRSPARPAPRRSSAWRRTRATWRRTSTSGCATTPGSSPSRRPKRRRSRVAVLVENGGFGASAAAPDRAQDHGRLSAAAPAAQRRRPQRSARTRTRGPAAGGRRHDPLRHQHRFDRTRTLSGAARVLLGAEARWPAAGGPRAGRASTASSCCTAPRARTGTR